MKQKKAGCPHCSLSPWNLSIEAARGSQEFTELLDETVEPSSLTRDALTSFNPANISHTPAAAWALRDLAAFANASNK